AVEPVPRRQDARQLRQRLLRPVLLVPGDEDDSFPAAGARTAGEDQPWVGARLDGVVTHDGWRVPGGRRAGREGQGGEEQQAAEGEWVGNGRHRSHTSDRSPAHAPGRDGCSSTLSVRPRPVRGTGNRYSGAPRRA